MRRVRHNFFERILNRGGTNYTIVMLSSKIICWDQVLFVWDMGGGGQRLPHQNRTKTILFYNKDRIIKVLSMVREDFGMGQLAVEGESGIGLTYHKFQIRVMTKSINISDTFEQIH